MEQRPERKTKRRVTSDEKTRSNNVFTYVVSRPSKQNKVYLQHREQEKLCLRPARHRGVHPSIQFLTTCESELCIRVVIPGV